MFGTGLLRPLINLGDVGNGASMYIHLTGSFPMFGTGLLRPLINLGDVGNGASMYIHMNYWHQAREASS
jgi:hypothetical protein